MRSQGAGAVVSEEEEIVLLAKMQAQRDEMTSSLRRQLGTFGWFARVCPTQIQFRTTLIRMICVTVLHGHPHKCFSFETLVRMITGMNNWNSEESKKTLQTKEQDLRQITELVHLCVVCSACFVRILTRDVCAAGKAESR
jgi:hypothetical protein